VNRRGSRSTPSPGVERGPGSRPPGRGRATTVLVLAVLVLGVLAVRAFVVLPVRIASASMEPTLGAGDVVLVSRSGLHPDEVARWDLVVFDDPRNGRRTIKRVVGLPGERVVVLDGVLHVDGRPVSEPWVDPESVDGYYSRTFRVPRAHVLVLGDNRGNSVDSRDYGTLPVEDLDGRLLVRLWPRPGRLADGA
jgi:signal peptidase I